MARKIEADVDLKKELEAIIAGLSDDLRMNMREGAEGAGEFVTSPELTEEDELQIRRILQ